VTVLSATYVHDHQNEVFDIQCKYLVNNAMGNSRKICMQTHWNGMKETERQDWCTQMWRSMQSKLPLFFRVASAMREVLWPTQEAGASFCSDAFASSVCDDAALPLRPQFGATTAVGSVCVFSSLRL
jgi:hypothetical protein